MNSIESRIRFLESKVSKNNKINEGNGALDDEYERLDEFYKKLVLLKKEYKGELRIFKLDSRVSELISDIELILI